MLILPSEIKVWTMDGDVVYTLSGHTSFVYSLSVLPNGQVVSGGEDRSVRVWRGMVADLILITAAHNRQTANVYKQSFILRSLSGQYPRCRMEILSAVLVTVLFECSANLKIVGPAQRT